MSPFPWLCQSLWKLTLSLITDWKVVSYILTDSDVMLRTLCCGECYSLVLCRAGVFHEPHKVSAEVLLPEALAPSLLCSLYKLNWMAQTESLCLISKSQICYSMVGISDKPVICNCMLRYSIDIEFLPTNIIYVINTKGQVEGRIFDRQELSLKPLWLNLYALEINWPMTVIVEFYPMTSFFLSISDVVSVPWHRSRNLLKLDLI